MNNFVKATVRKLAQLPWPDLRDLFSWPSGGSTIQAENPNLLIAKAANERGEVVAYVTAEPILLVGSSVSNPNIPISDLGVAGEVGVVGLVGVVGVVVVMLRTPGGGADLCSAGC